MFSRPGTSLHPAASKLSTAKCSDTGTSSQPCPNYGFDVPDGSFAPSSNQDTGLPPAAGPCATSWGNQPTLNAVVHFVGLLRLVKRSIVWKHLRLLEKSTYQPSKLTKETAKSTQDSWIGLAQPQKVLAGRRIRQPGGRQAAVFRVVISARGTLLGFPSYCRTVVLLVESMSLIGVDVTSHRTAPNCDGGGI